MNNKSIIALAVATIVGSAYGASDYIDTAQVISSKPIIERVSESRQECDPAPQKSGSSIVAPIIGGVVGGLLGHQVGQGSGKTAATIVGATGGAVAGSAIANRSGQQPAQQCRNVQSSREVVNGYDVVYRYNGRDVNVALPYDPGSTIKVGVAAILDERTAEGRRDNDRDSRPVSSANTGDKYNELPYRGRSSPQY